MLTPGITQQSNNILIHYSDDCPLLLASPTSQAPTSFSLSMIPTPLPHSSIIFSTVTQDSSTHIVQSYSPFPKLTGGSKGSGSSSSCILLPLNTRNTETFTSHLKFFFFFFFFFFFIIHYGLFNTPILLKILSDIPFKLTNEKIYGFELLFLVFMIIVFFCCGAHLR